MLAQQVEIKAGVLAYEVGDGLGAQVDAPGVLLLQEWWGVTDIIKSQAAKISKDGGYRVLIPDLYKGKLGLDKEEASHLMGDLDFKQATEDITDTVNYLRDSGSKKVGVAGFCMGGGLTFCAAQFSNVDCAAPFYGTPKPEVCQVEKIKVPILAQFGGKDSHIGFSDPKTAQEIADKITTAGGSIDLHIYPGCGHAFFNALDACGMAKIKQTGQVIPPESEVQESYQRLMKFFDAHLH